MTRPVEEHEISALIDGELDEPRAAEVRTAIQQDPAIRAQYERLAAADRTWSAAAATAQFQPAITQEHAPARNGDWTSAIIAAATLLAAVARMLSKNLEFDLGPAAILHASLLTVVIIVIVWVATGDHDERATTLALR
jgi:anti-sigma factor RsiW